MHNATAFIVSSAAAASAAAVGATVVVAGQPASAERPDPPALQAFAGHLRRLAVACAERRTTQPALPE